MRLLRKSLIAPSLALLLATNLYSASFTVDKIDAIKAIEKISELSKVPFIVDKNILKGITTNTIENIDNLEEALRLMFEGTGIEATVQNNTIVIKKLSSVKVINGTYILDEVSVKSNTLRSTTENSNSYTTGSMNTATKLDLSIRETPQSVVVITKQQMEDFNYNSFEDIVNNTAGLRASKTDTDRVYMTARGFEIDYYQLDGIPTSRYITLEDLSIYDRVEIVKGANGLMSGVGNPAASMNLVRKHANSKVFKGDITLQGGSWDTYKGTVDLQTPLNSDGSIRGRIVASYADQNSYKDFYSKESNTLYAVIDVDISDNTQVSVGASRLESKPKGTTWGGVPIYFSDGTLTNFSPKDSFVTDWAYYNKETESAFLNFEHYFDNDIKIKANYSYYKTSSETNMLYMNYSNLDKNTGLGTSTTSPWKSNGKDVDNTFDIYASIPFELGNKEHEIIAGIMYQKKDSDNFGQKSSKVDLSGNSIYNWNANIPEPTYESKIRSGENSSEQKSAYIVGRFSLLDDLTLITGGRLTNYESNDKFNNYLYKNNNVFIPYAGLVYNIDENHSIYTSYTDIFQPQDNKDKSGKKLDPREGNNYEIGIKGEYLNKKLNTGLTLFRVQQDNVPTLAGVDPITGDSYYTAEKGSKTEGIEFDLNGEILDNWNVGFGISYYEMKNAKGERRSTLTPQTQVMLSSTYKIGDLTFGGNVHWRSEFYTDLATPAGKIRATQDDFFVVDAMARYEFNKNLSAQLNINNLFDKEYYSNMVYSNQYIFGDPRSAMLTLKYKF
ncbi:TonB-dependent siderophore receptor [Aliarcobacter lanthieri]|uniref:TonB-dependent siderophore receptor n=1 Tax=Aliarcobacter lanthieri TaxID=1355374 RepID=UPI003AAD13F6